MSQEISLTLNQIEDSINSQIQYMWDCVYDSEGSIDPTNDVKDLDNARTCIREIFKSSAHQKQQEEKKISHEITDSLKELFSMQWELNNKIFEKKGIKDLNGKPMSMGDLYNEGKLEGIGPNTITNEWLSKFLTALNDECRELKEELLWKWWSKDTLNMQNIRVEIVDILHFWICLALSAGMDYRDVLRIYKQKNEVNLNRNQSDYSKENKIDDNKEIV